MDISAEDQVRIDSLRALLDELGLSQRDAAMVAGINQRTMRRMCSGHQPIPNWLESRLRERIADPANFSAG